MKTFIKKLLFFVLFFLSFTIAINSAFLGIIAYTDWDFVKRRESLNFENPDFRLLVLGSSLAEYGIDTELLTLRGIKSFNLCFVGSSIRTYYVQLKEYVNNYSIRPEYVLVAVNSYLEDFEVDGIQPVVEFTMKDYRYKIKDIPISKFNWAGWELIKKALKRKYNKTHVSYGQKKTIDIVPDTSNYKGLTLNIKKYESAIWLGEIAKLCKQNKINLIIIEIPGTKDTQNNSKIGPYNISFTNGYSAVLYNLNDNNFFKTLNINDNSDWAGRSHFNKSGAAKFTNELYEIIKNHAFIE